MQVSTDGSLMTVDDANIAWKTDVNKRFPAAPATDFNTIPDLRGGGTVTGPIKVPAKCPSLPVNSSKRIPTG